MAPANIMLEKKYKMELVGDEVILYQKCTSLRNIFGTFKGKKSDVDVFVRGMIERTLTSPDMCSYLTFEEKDVGVHYEINESGENEFFLPALVARLSEEDAPVFVFGGTERQTRVWRKDDGGLISVWLSEAECVDVEVFEQEGDVLQPTNKGKFYYENKGILRAAAISTLVLGGVIFTSGSLVALSDSYASRGLSEMVSSLPTSRLYELKDHKELKKTQLPIAKMAEAQRSVRPDEYVKKIEFANNEWKITYGLINSIPVSHELNDEDHVSPGFSDSDGGDEGGVEKNNTTSGSRSTGLSPARSINKSEVKNKPTPNEKVHSRLKLDNESYGGARDALENASPEERIMKRKAEIERRKAAIRDRNYMGDNPDKDNVVSEGDLSLGDMEKGEKRS